MDNTPLVQKTSTTFIPKNKQTPARRKKYYNIFFGFSIFALFGVLSLWGGLFIYNRILVTEKSQVDNQLKTITSNIVSEELIKDFQILDLRLTTAEKLLNQHVNLAPFISLLEDQTLTNSVRFANIDFSHADGTFSVSMSGVARNFESLGYQKKVFTDEPSFTNIVFDGFSINEETGNIDFNTTFDVLHDLLSYKKQKEVGAPDIIDDNGN